MALIQEDFMNDLYNQKFWEKDNIQLFHSESSGEKIIIVGNMEKQLQINFISHLDNIYPYIHDKKYSFTNLQIIGLSLKYPRNRLKLKNIIKEFISENILTNNITKNKNLNLYLKNETTTFKFPIDFELIKNTEINNNIYENCDILKNIVSKTSSKDIIIKEIKDFNSDLSFNDYIEPIQNNIFKFYLHLFKNDKLKCKILIDIDSNFYPMMPPKITWISPVINKIDYAAIINSKIFSSNWNPIINIKWLFTQLKEKLLEYENKFNTTIFSENTDEFNKLDNLIINFTKTIGRFTSPNTIQIDFNPIDFSSNEKKHWVKGTGYGHDGLQNWSLDKYLNEQANIQNNIINYIIELLLLEDIPFESKKFICEQSFIDVSGITLMDLEKSSEFYLKYYELIDHTYSNDFNFEKISSWKDNISILIENINMSGTTNENINEIKVLLEKLNNKIITKNKIDEEIINNNYEDIMKPLQFGYYDVTKTKHTFKNKIGKPNNTKQMMRIAQEISSLQKSLPLNSESSVWMRIDKNNMNTMQFLISGPKDTPYQDGLFLFDCHFNNLYPKQPPNVIIQTTGGGKFRFNPNLYANGKVCLSLLGTWSGTAGEKWNEKTSTMLQVIVSIQSLILIEQPYFNEPGYEKEIGTKAGKSRSDHYNQKIKSGTSLYAIKDMIENPPFGFEEVVIQHFNHKKDNIIKTLTQWKENVTKQEYKDDIKNTLQVIEKI